MAECVDLLCQQHTQDVCQFFCKQCKECICFKCLSESHDDHTFCKLKAAEVDMVGEIKAFYEDTDGEKGNSKTGLIKLLNEYEENRIAEKEVLREEVENAVQSIIAHVTKSKEKLLAQLDDMFTGILKSKCDLVTQIQEYSLKMEKTNMTFDDVLKDFIKIRNFSLLCDDELSKITKPVFVFNTMHDDIGHFETVPVNHSNQNVKETQESEVNDSDIVREICPVLVDAELNSVDKIVPISLNEAWIMFTRNSFKCLGKLSSDGIQIYNNISIQYTFYTYIRDFLVLRDGSLLVYEGIGSDLIKIWTHCRRKLKFADLGNARAPSLHLLKDNYVGVNTDSGCIIFNQEGIKMSDLNTGIPSFEKSNTYIQNQTWEVIEEDDQGHSIIVLSKYNAKYTQNKNCHKDEIRKITFKRDASPSVGYFHGVFGNNFPEFECGGICIDRNKHIVVSDVLYKCVYVLDKDLNYLSTLIRAEEFLLEAPGPVAVYEDVLWCIDGDKLFKFKYDSQKAVLNK